MKIDTLGCVALMALAVGCSAIDDAKNGGGAGGGKEPTAPLTGTLVINEVYAKHQKDWVELYNGTDEAIDLNGYRITDDKSRLHVPEGTIIESRQFLTFFRTELPENNTFSLNELADEVHVWDRNDIEVDAVYWTEFWGNGTLARSVDGGGEFLPTGTATPNAGNEMTNPEEAPEEEDEPSEEPAETSEDEDADAEQPAE